MLRIRRVTFLEKKWAVSVATHIAKCLLQIIPFFLFFLPAKKFFIWESEIRFGIDTIRLRMRFFAEFCAGSDLYFW